MATSTLSPSAYANLPRGTLITEVNNQIVRVTIPDPSDNLIVTEGQTFDNSDIVSAVIDLSLVDSDGNIIQPSSHVEICFDVSNSRRNSDLCLGSYNEDNQEWKCDDYCLERRHNNLLCGTVNHFTNFAILLQGGGENGCGGNDYILGSSFNDFMLIMSCVVFCIVFGCIFLFISRTKLCESVVYSQEVRRVIRLRRETNSIAVEH